MRPDLNAIDITRESSIARRHADHYFRPSQGFQPSTRRLVIRYRRAFSKGEWLAQSYLEHTASTALIVVVLTRMARRGREPCPLSRRIQADEVPY